VTENGRAHAERNVMKMRTKALGGTRPRDRNQIEGQDTRTAFTREQRRGRGDRRPINFWVLLFYENWHSKEILMKKGGGGGIRDKERKGRGQRFQRI